MKNIRRNEHNKSIRRNISALSYRKYIGFIPHIKSARVRKQ